MRSTWSEAIPPHLASDPPGHWESPSQDHPNKLAGLKKPRKPPKSMLIILIILLQAKGVRETPAPLNGASSVRSVREDGGGAGFEAGTNGGICPNGSMESRWCSEQDRETPEES